jgi:2-dehydro-3-deoxygluconokinase
MPELMNYVDVCIGNEEDADKMLGISPESTDVQSGKILIRDYTDVCKRICTTYGCKYCAFTLRESYSASVNGWGGILYDSTSDSSFISKHYDVQITDRMGAGDSFSAAMIFCLLNHYDGQKTIDFSVAASCLKHTINDDFNLTTEEEILDLMNGDGNGRIQR